MCKHGLLFPILTLLAAPAAQAQFDMTQVQYWVGSGPDSSVLVVDFQDGSPDPSYAWGWLHEGGTGEDMINAIAAADTNMTIDVPGGFLNDLTYGSHAGIGGAPNWWSTWSGTSIADMVSNLGLATVLGNGEWFGCSYTDFNPALAPTEPWAAFEPFAFSFHDVEYWVGSGSDSALFVLDFHDGLPGSSTAWGYRYSGTADVQDMIQAVDAQDGQLSTTINSGALMAAEYGVHSGMAGIINSWSQWSGSNLGTWAPSEGLTTTLESGKYYGCSYHGLGAAPRPDTPEAAALPTEVAEHPGSVGVFAWPQPATDHLDVRMDVHAPQEVRMFDLHGQRVFAGMANGGRLTIDVSSWPAGLYLLQTAGAQRTVLIH
jgi:hypothetical protein